MLYISSSLPHYFLGNKKERLPSITSVHAQTESKLSATHSAAPFISAFTLEVHFSSRNSNDTDTLSLMMAKSSIMMVGGSILKSNEMNSSWRQMKPNLVLTLF